MSSPISNSFLRLNLTKLLNVVVASFFEDRVETVELENGGTAFIQRPKAKAEGSVQSAADLPDDFDISSISANSTKLYRISIGPIEVSTPVLLFCILLLSICDAGYHQLR